MFLVFDHEYPQKTARADVRLDVPGEPSEVVSISIDDNEEGYPERKEKYRMAGGQLVLPIEGIRSHRTVILRF